MSVPYQTLIRFLPILLLVFVVVPGPAKPPGTDQGTPSAWWYPLGNPEGTRRNSVPTGSQKAEDLKVKWRTGALKNSSVLLVGGIRTAAGKSDQQIVGLEEGSNRITILSSKGFVDTTLEIEDANLLSLNLQLTGLFNTAAPSVIPQGRPNVIGVAIKDWPITTSSSPFGLLIDGRGKPINRLGLSAGEIQKVAAFTNAENRKLTIYPVAAYTPSGEMTPVAVALVSQDRFVRNGSGTLVDSMVNSIRKYTLVSSNPNVFANPLGQSYFIAPKPYYTAPAFLVDATGKQFISLSTERYDNITPGIGLRDGTDVTRSDLATPLHFNISATPPQRLAYEPALVAGASASTSHFTMLTITENGGTKKDSLVRVFAEQRVTDAEGPLLQLTTGTAPGAITNYVPSDNPEQKGWLVVVADVDGKAPGFGDPGSHTTTQFVNNPGNELVLTTQPDGSGGSGKNWVYLFRYNLKTPVNSVPFSYFARQLLAGRIVASGDLVADTNNREELLLADQNTLSVLQLKDYDLYEEIQRVLPTENRPFYFLDTFNFSSPIISVAVADLEGDGENDIIVCTKDSTYAIGKVQPNPYPFNTQPDPFNREYCPDDSVRLSWERNVGGESEAIDVRIIGESGSRPISPSRFVGDSVKFTPASPGLLLGPGTYKIVISNSSYPYITDTSAPFTVVKGTLGQLDFPNATPYRIGAAVADTIGLHCISDPRLQRSMGDSLSWVDVPEALAEIDESRAGFSDVISCPEILECGANGEQRIYYRVVSATDTTPARGLDIALPHFSFSVSSGLSRNRFLTWIPADFPCTELSISLSSDGGKTWHSEGSAGTLAGMFEFAVPDEIADSVLVCVQCADPGECGYGVQRFEVSPIDFSSYVYPNPFDPESGGSGGRGAEIVYLLKNPGFVSITIYDASRTVVRKLVESEERQAGRNRGDFWDGRNFDGQYVANGTYICVISLSPGEQIILPIAVVKRR